LVDTSPPQDVSNEEKPQGSPRRKRLLAATVAALSLSVLSQNWYDVEGLLLRYVEIPFFRSNLPTGLKGTKQLAMQGGDPYIRALMRTISASESNYAQPYHVLYGGKYVRDLSRHPNRCVRINIGPNKGNCSTAAGRYQFLNKTWKQMAQRYHPSPRGLLLWKSYSFEPEYQDRVVYAWLSDRQFWKADLAQMLRQGKVRQVLRMLSGTWTSLGYGIETNSMSRHLPKIYEKMLKEELGKAQ
jgi:muramidase (phage lysozyme)